MIDSNIPIQAAKVTKHIVQKIQELELHDYPFKHGTIFNFLPAAFYQKLDENFPHYNNKKFAELRHGRYMRDFFMYNDTDFIENVIESVFKNFSSQIVAGLFKKFNFDYNQKLVTWHCSYMWNIKQPKPIDCIGPHIDDCDRLITLLLYLPFKDQIIPGTDILEKNSDNTFKIIRTTDAAANSCLIIEKTKDAWHRARPTNSDRRVIAFWLKHPEARNR